MGFYILVFVSLVSSIDIPTNTECVPIDSTSTAVRVLANPINDLALFAADPGAAGRHGLDPPLLISGGRCFSLW